MTQLQIKPCKQMPITERIDRVWSYRYRIGDEARGRFAAGTCRICGNPLPLAYSVFENGKFYVDYAPGSKEAEKCDRLIENNRLHTIETHQVFPHTVCEAVATDEVWNGAIIKEKQLRAEAEAAKQAETETTRKTTRQPRKMGGYY